MGTVAAAGLQLRFCPVSSLLFMGFDGAEPDIVVLIRRIVVVAIRGTQVRLIIVVAPPADHARNTPSISPCSPACHAQNSAAKSYALGMPHMPDPRRNGCTHR